jgi:hypothetical protein
MQPGTHSEQREPQGTVIQDGGQVIRETTGDGSLTKDDIFEVLYNRRRRMVIWYLRDNDGTGTVSDLAEYIAADENDTTVKQLSSSERKRVYVGLYQNHLPMMDNVGVISYDKNRGTVQLQDVAAELEPYLGETDGADESHAKLTGVLTLSGVILLGILDVSSLGAIPDLLWVVLGVCGLLVLAVEEELGVMPEQYWG